MTENTVLAELIRRLKSREAKVAVLGLGYVGCPWRPSRRGRLQSHRVDPDENKINALRRGRVTSWT